MIKKFISIICIICMMATLSACEQDDRIVLNIYNVGDYIDLEVLDIFEQEHPDIKINRQIIW